MIGTIAQGDLEKNTMVRKFEKQAVCKGTRVSIEPFLRQVNFVGTLQKLNLASARDMFPFRHNLAYVLPMGLTIIQCQFLFKDYDLEEQERLLKMLREREDQIKSDPVTSTMPTQVIKI